MTPSQVLNAMVVEVTLTVVILGLLFRRRETPLWSFTGMVAAMLTCNVLVTWWPGHFYVPEFWMAKEILYTVLQLGVAAEVAWRTFRPFPGASASAARAGRWLLVTTTALMLLAPTSSSPYLTVAGELLPRLLNGAVWMMAATLALSKWYRVPLYTFHVAIIASLGGHLMLSSTLLRLVAVYGWGMRDHVNALVPPAYLAVAAWWAYAAWRPERESARAAVLSIIHAHGAR